MADPFITLNGDPGEFLSRADVNLLDADTAHLQQSIGTWLHASGSTGPTLASDIPPIFGTFHGKTSTSTGADVRLRTALGVDGQPALPDTVYSVSAYLARGSTSTPGTNVRLRTTFYDAGGVAIQETLRDPVPLPVANEWVHVTMLELSPPLTEFVGMSVAWIGGGLQIGDELYWDANLIAERSDPTFVPSLRIVGNLDLEARAASVDWTDTHQDLIDNRDVALGYLLRISPTGGVIFSYGNGATNRQAESSAPGFVDGVTATVRATLDIAGTIEWFLDGVPFDTAGSDPGAGVPSDLDVAIGIESQNHINWPFHGDIEYAQIRDGIDGPVVYRMDAADALGSV